AREAAREGGRAARSARLDRALDLAGLDAARADVHPLRVTLDQRAYTLDVGVPTARRTAVRVRYLHPEPRTAATNVTDGCHSGGGFYRPGRAATTAKVSQKRGFVSI